MEHGARSGEARGVGARVSTDRGAAVVESSRLAVRRVGLGARRPDQSQPGRRRHGCLDRGRPLLAERRPRHQLRRPHLHYVEFVELHLRPQYQLDDPAAGDARSQHDLLLEGRRQRRDLHGSGRRLELHDRRPRPGVRADEPDAGGWDDQSGHGSVHPGRLFLDRMPRRRDFEFQILSWNGPEQSNLPGFEDGADGDIFGVSGV